MTKEEMKVFWVAASGSPPPPPQSLDDDDEKKIEKTGPIEIVFTTWEGEDVVTEAVGGETVMELGKRLELGAMEVSLTRRSSFFPFSSSLSRSSFGRARDLTTLRASISINQLGSLRWSPRGTLPSRSFSSLPASPLALNSLFPTSFSSFLLLPNQQCATCHCFISSEPSPAPVPAITDEEEEYVPSSFSLSLRRVSEAISPSRLFTACSSTP